VACLPKGDVPARDYIATALNFAHELIYSRAVVLFLAVGAIGGIKSSQNKATLCDIVPLAAADGAGVVRVVVMAGCGGLWWVVASCSEFWWVLAGCG
jgi:hypothetical protein